MLGATDSAWSLLEGALAKAQEEDGDTVGFYPAPAVVSTEVAPSVLLREGEGAAVIGGTSTLQPVLKSVGLGTSPIPMCGAGVEGDDVGPETEISQRTTGRLPDAEAAAAAASEGSAAGEGEAGGEELGEDERVVGSPSALDGAAGPADSADDDAAHLPPSPGTPAEPPAGPAAPPVPYPKKAMTPWAYWLTETQGGKPSKAAGEAWRALSDDAKAPWTERAAADKARHPPPLHPSPLHPSTAASLPAASPTAAALPAAASLLPPSPPPPSPTRLATRQSWRHTTRRRSGARRWPPRRGGEAAAARRWRQARPPSRWRACARR